MSIEFHCPACGNLARTPRSMAGRRGKCPKCDVTITIPEDSEGDTINEEDLLLGVDSGDEDDSQASVPGIEFDCKGCHQLVKTPLSAAGKKGRCPHCDAVVRIPKQSQVKLDDPPPADVISFSCPLCTNPVRTPLAAAGKKGQCPNCKEIIQIPAKSQPLKPTPQKAAVKSKAAAKSKAPAAPKITSDTIEFGCQSCGGEVRTPASAAGKKGKCPHCDAVVQIPAKPERAAAPQAKSPAKPQAKSPAKPSAKQGIEFPCPSCTKEVRTPPGSGGKKGKCPHCGLVLRIPDHSQPSKPAAKPAAAAQKPAAKKSAAKSGSGKKTSSGNKASDANASPSQGTPQSTPSTGLGGALAGDDLGLAEEPAATPAPANPTANADLASQAVDPMTLTADIEFQCPSCQEQVTTPRQTAGKKGRCPHCQAIFQIPKTSTQPTQPLNPPTQSPAAPANPTSPLGGLTPVATPGLTPIGSGGGLTPLDGGVGGGLQPVDGTPGLTPIGGAGGTPGLTPIGGAGGTPGLTPIGGPPADNPYDWATAESSAAPAAHLGSAGGAVNPFASPTAPSKPSAKPIDDSRRGGLPWEQKRGDGKFGRTVKMVLFNPSEAFLKMRVQGGLGGPIGFMCLGMLAAAGATMLYVFLVIALGMAFGPAGADPDRMAAVGAGVVGVVIGAVLGFGMAIPFAILGQFIHAGVLHLVLMMVGGARRGFEATFRVTCFTTGSIMLWYVLPYCLAWIPATVCYFISTIIGLSRAHSISGGKAAIAVVAPMAIPMIFFVFNLAMAIMAAAQAAASRGGPPF